MIIDGQQAGTHDTMQCANSLSYEAMAVATSLCF